jgi:hypothetical protein
MRRILEEIVLLRVRSPGLGRELYVAVLSMPLRVILAPFALL